MPRIEAGRTMKKETRKYILSKSYAEEQKIARAAKVANDKDGLNLAVKKMQQLLKIAKNEGIEIQLA
jgi:hypothetical protein